MRRIAAVWPGPMFCLAARVHVQPGDTLPDALSTIQNGQEVTVSSLHGKVVVISSRVTWCGYCMKEMPVLANLQSLATRRGLPLQVVTINYRENRCIFVNTVRALCQPLPGLLMTWDRNGTRGKPYGSDKAIPVMADAAPRQPRGPGARGVWRGQPGSRGQYPAHRARAGRGGRRTALAVARRANHAQVNLAAAHGAG